MRLNNKLVELEELFQKLCSLRKRKVLLAAVQRNCAEAITVTKHWIERTKALVAHNRAVADLVSANRDKESSVDAELQRLRTENEKLSSDKTKTEKQVRALEQEKAQLLLEVQGRDGAKDALKNKIDSLKTSEKERKQQHKGSVDYIKSLFRGKPEYTQLFEEGSPKKRRKLGRKVSD